MYQRYTEDIAKRKKLQCYVVDILQEKFKIFKQMIHDERVAQFDANEAKGKTRSEISGLKIQIENQEEKRLELRAVIANTKLQRIPNPEKTQQHKNISEQLAKTHNETASLSRDLENLANRKESLEQKYGKVKKGIDVEKKRRGEIGRTSPNGKTSEIKQQNACQRSDIGCIEQEIEQAKRELSKVKEQEDKLKKISAQKSSKGKRKQPYK